MFGLEIVEKIQTIYSGGKASLSPAQIQNGIISLQDAKAALPPEEYQKFYDTFQQFQKTHKREKKLDLNGYMECCSEIIEWVEEFAPYPIVSGNASEEEIQQFRQFKEKEANDNREVPVVPAVPAVPTVKQEKSIEEKDESISYCPSCGAFLQIDSAFCHKCGSEIPKTDRLIEWKTCTQCGHRISEDAKYCAFCGTMQGTSQVVISEEELKKHRNDYQRLNELLKSEPINLHFSNEEIENTADFYTIYKYVGKNHLLKAINDYAAEIKPDDFNQKVKLFFVFGTMQADGLLDESEVKELQGHFGPEGWEPFEIDENALKEEAVKRASSVAQKTLSKTDDKPIETASYSVPDRAHPKKKIFLKAFTFLALCVVAADAIISVFVNHRIGAKSFYLQLAMPLALWFIGSLVHSLFSKKKLYTHYPRNSFIGIIIGTVVLDVALISSLYMLNSLQIISYSKNIWEMEDGEYAYRTTVLINGKDSYSCPALIVKENGSVICKKIYFDDGVISENIVLDENLKAPMHTAYLRDTKTGYTVGNPINFVLYLKDDFDTVPGRAPQGPFRKSELYLLLIPLLATIVMQGKALFSDD